MSKGNRPTPPGEEGFDGQQDSQEGLASGDTSHREAPSFRHQDKFIIRAVLCCCEGSGLEDDPARDLQLISSLARLLPAGSGDSNLPLLACPQPSMAALAPKGIFTF